MRSSMPILAAFALSSTLFAQPYEYALFRIDRLPGGGWMVPWRVSEGGHVVGSADTASGYFHGFQWMPGQGSVDLPPHPGRTDAEVKDLSADGTIAVGMSELGAFNDEATIWEDGVPRLLPNLGGPYSEVTALNEQGQMVGWSDLPEFGRHPVRWMDGEVFDLGDLGDVGGEALDLNEAGQIVGWSAIGGGRYKPFLWQDGVMTELPLPPGNGLLGRAFAINNHGDSVGSVSGFPYAACAWIDGEPISLRVNGFPAEDSGALDINDHGLIVGWYQRSEHIRDMVSFIYDLHDESPRMIDLNTLIPPRSGWFMAAARSINNAGQICSDARRENAPIGSQNQAFLVNPVHPTMTLRPTGGGLAAGQVNQLVVENATPGARVVFTYSLKGGGEFIPGCDLQENALQLDKPKSLGHRRADANGVAKLRVFVPPAAQGQTVLVQAVVVEECAVSGLMVEEVQ